MNLCYLCPTYRRSKVGGLEKLLLDLHIPRHECMAWLTKGIWVRISRILLDGCIYVPPGQDIMAIILILPSLAIYDLVQPVLKQTVRLKLKCQVSL